MNLVNFVNFVGRTLSSFGPVLGHGMPVGQDFELAPLHGTTHPISSPSEFKEA